MDFGELPRQNIFSVLGDGVFMPRKPREKSSTGIYHVMIRGVNKENIFQDDDDRRMFLHILKKISLLVSFHLLAYCLMDNHVHLLIKTDDDISRIMRRLGTSYVLYYNNKYERVGHLFQNRFKSEKVETERYLITVLRYIHQNPIKAGITSELNYPWSSHLAYMGYQKKQYPKVDTDFILFIFSEDKNKALLAYKDFMNILDNEANCLEYVNPLTDRELERELLHLLQGLSIAHLQTMKKNERDAILKQAKKLEGVSIRQIERVTGIGRCIIAKA